MSPTVATWFTLISVLLVLWHDARHGEARSPALWIPVLWLFVTGSRFVSQWLEFGAASDDSYAEGSPLDALFFGLLIAAALMVLSRRRVTLSEVVRHNRWLAAMCIFGLVSILWSDFPFNALKRWVKTLGHPLMAMIVLTDPNPRAALRAVLHRCATLLLPISVLFIKYLPEYGRGFDQWTGEAFNNGIGLNKNSLGYICLVFGIFYSWLLLGVRRAAAGDRPWREAAWVIAYLWMTLWLLDKSNSATSLSALLAGVTTMIALGLRWVSKKHFGIVVVSALLIAAGIESAFDAYANVIALLGRNPTLTDRSAVWADALALQNRPLFGFGFESFWLGERLDVLWSKWWWHPNQAHNGYIETYLNLGFVGLVMLAGLLWSTFRKISRQLLTDFEFARLRMAFLIAIMLFNYTEAAFKAVHFIWTIFHVIAMDWPRKEVDDTTVSPPHERGES